MLCTSVMHRYIRIKDPSSGKISIENLDDFRAKGFPNVEQTLKNELKSHRSNRLRDFGLNVNEFEGKTTTWKYSGGSYEIWNDIVTLSISANSNNQSVISDIETALLKSGLFVQVEEK